MEKKKIDKFLKKLEKVDRKGLIWFIWFQLKLILSLSEKLEENEKKNTHSQRSDVHD